MLFFRLTVHCICVNRKRYSVVGSAQSDAFVARCLCSIPFRHSVSVQLTTSVAGPGSMAGVCSNSKRQGFTVKLIHVR